MISQLQKSAFKTFLIGLMMNLAVIVPVSLPVTLTVASTVTFIVFGFNSGAQAESKTGPSEGAHYFMCKLGAQVRTIRMHREKYNAPAVEIGASQPPAVDGCEVAYTKLGKDKVVASAKSLNFCESKMNELKDKLSGGGWKCRDISQSVVHDEHEPSLSEHQVVLNAGENSAKAEVAKPETSKKP